MLKEGYDLLKYEGARLVEAIALRPGECDMVYISLDGRNLILCPVSPMRASFIKAVMEASKKEGAFSGLGTYTVQRSGAFSFSKA